MMRKNDEDQSLQGTHDIIAINNRLSFHTRFFCNYNLLMVIKDWKALMVLFQDLVYYPKMKK